MSSCRKQTICGVTAEGTPFDLIEQLTYNPSSTTFPTDYLIAFTDTTFIYCIDDDGYERTITCVTDPVTHKIIKVCLILKKVDTFSNIKSQHYEGKKFK